MNTNSPSGATPFPFDPARTAIVQEYREKGMIADRVLPPTPPLGKTEFKYFKYKMEDAFVVPDAEMGRKGMPHEVEFEGEEVVDQCINYGLRDSVPQQDIDDAAATATSAMEWADPVDTAALFLTHLLKLNREVRVANLVFNTNSYGADYRMAVGNGSRFDDADSDPWSLLETGMNTPLQRPNIAVFGQEAWSKFRAHPKVLKAVHGNDGDAGLATRRAVAEELEVDEVLVGRSRIANNKEGQPLALKRAWGKSVALLYRGAFLGGGKPGGKPGSEGTMELEMTTTDRRNPTFGFTGIYLPLSVHSRFRSERGAKGEHEVLVRESCKEVVSGKEFGFYFSTVVD
ncbi:MAG: phage capsid protein [Gammaproteobacteria bacterium]|nr:phage capsid protein [Gammaproteobacteria bacterium]